MKKIQIFAIVLGLGFMVGCSDDSEESSNVSGSAVKGYVGSAKVNMYQYVEGGLRGKLLASTVTDNTGNFNASVDYRGAVEIVISEGSYKDEATGHLVELGEENELRSVVMLSGNKEVAVSALTTIAAEHADAHASAGLAIAIENANRTTARAFGLSEVDITTVIPADLSFRGRSHSEAQLKYGVIQAGLSQYVKEEGLSASDLLVLVDAFAEDFADGQVDGNSGSAALEFSLSITPEQALTGLNVAIENFLKSENNRSEFSGSFTFTFSASGE